MKTILTILLLVGSAMAQLPAISTSAPGCSPASSLPYTTSFPTNESPLSECNSWQVGGAYGWNNPNVSGNTTVGTQTGVSNDFLDSWAVLNVTTGNNQEVQVKAKVANKPSVADYEIEALTRRTVGSNNTTGYEMNWILNSTTANCAVQANRWNGAVGSFTQLASCVNNGASYCVNDNDILTFQTVGSTLVGYINGIKVSTCTDATYSSGKMGLGLYFWLNGGSGSNSDFGHRSWLGTDNPRYVLASKSNNISTSGTTVAVSTLNTTGAKYLLIIAYWASTSKTGTVSCTNAGSATSLTGPTTMLTSYRHQVYKIAAPTTNASETCTLTLSGTAATTDRAISVLALSGVTVEDQVTTLATGTSATPASATTGTTTAANELIVGDCIFGGSSAASYTLPNRYTIAEDVNFGSNVVAWGITTATGTFNFTSNQGSSAAYGCWVGTFK